MRSSACKGCVKEADRCHPKIPSTPAQVCLEINVAAPPVVSCRWGYIEEIIKTPFHSHTSISSPAAGVSHVRPCDNAGGSNHTVWTEEWCVHERAVSRSMLEVLLSRPLWSDSFRARVPLGARLNIRERHDRSARVGSTRGDTEVSMIP